MLDRNTARGLRGARASANLEPLVRARSQQDRLDLSIAREFRIASGLQDQGFDRFDILRKHRLEPVDAVGKRSLSLVRMRADGEESTAVLRVRQVIAQRRVAGLLLDLRRQILNQIRQAVGILGLKRVQNLRLQIAAQLRPRCRRQQQQS